MGKNYIDDVEINASENIRVRNRINERFENNIEYKLRFPHRFFDVRYSYYTSRSSSSLFFFHRIILPYYFLTISIEIYSQPVPSKFGRLVTAANRVTTHPVRPLLFFLKSSRRLFFPLPTVLSFYVTSLNFRGRAVELSFGTCSLRLNLNTDRSHRAYAFCTCDKIIYRQNLVPSALIFSYAIEISFQLVTEARFIIYKRSTLARIKYGLRRKFPFGNFQFPFPNNKNPFCEAIHL